MAERALLETSWEVCHKVGGIHTVLAGKLAYAQQEYGDNYTLVGFWDTNGKNEEFQAADAPAFWQEIIRELADQHGIVAHYGSWKLPGSPRVILLDHTGLLEHTSGIKEHFWNRYKLDTWNSDFWMEDNPLVWGVAAGMLAELFSDRFEGETVVHAHEWLCAGALLRLRETRPYLRTVFTTHATVLGRAATGNWQGLPEDSARYHNVWVKHQLERLAGKLATVSTAVSPLTADEARRAWQNPHVKVTPNGLPISQPFSAKKKASAALQKRLATVDANLPDLSSATVVATFGRYEFWNKGYDRFIRSLEAWRGKLDQTGGKGVALILVPFPHDAGQPAEHRYSPCKLGDGSWELVHALENAGFTNDADQPVHVIWLPFYLNGADGWLDLDLLTVLRGVDYAALLSRYEPWGLTPWESWLMGIPTLASREMGSLLYAQQQRLPLAPLLPVDGDDAVAIAEILMRPAKRQQPDPLAVEALDWEKLYRIYSTAYRNG